MMFRKALLPILEKPLDDQCRSNSHNMHCFKGGDSRTNEQPGKLNCSISEFYLSTLVSYLKTIHTQ